MKKISLSFVVTLVALFLASFSCQDHYVPPTPPQIETLEFEYVESERTQGVLGLLNFNLEFLTLGTVPVSDIQEYGIVYTTYTGEQVKNQAPEIGGADTHTEIFTAPVILGPIDQNGTVPSFYEIHYRAYAKLAGGQIIYGKILHYYVPL